MEEHLSQEEGMPRPGIYALGDDQGHVFVAKTEEDVVLRVGQYLTGERIAPVFLSGGNMRQLALLCAPEDVPNDLESWLRCEVLARMHHHGLHNVRGWLFHEPTLSPFQKRMAFEQVCHRHHLCTLCGSDAHVERDCTANVHVEWAACLDCE